MKKHVSSLHCEGDRPEERRQAVFFLLLAALFWSLAGVLIKSIAWDPLGIAGVRSAIAVPVLLIYLRRPRFTWSKAQVGGAVFYAAVVILFVVATKTTTAANAILLQFTAPVYGALFGYWFLGERTNRSDWLIIIVVLGGISLFFMDQLDRGGVFGNCCALLSGVCFAMFTICMRRQKHDSPMESIILGNLIAAAIGIGFSTDIDLGATNWGLMLVLGVVQLGIPYILYVRAIKHVSAVEALLIPSIEPILNPLFVLLLIGEMPGSWALLGGCVVLLGVTTRGIITVRSTAPSKLGLEPGLPT